MYLAETAWIIKSLQQGFPVIRFHYTSELKLPAVCDREFTPYQTTGNALAPGFKGEMQETG